jgi:acetyl-CoA acyltransferase 1
LPNLNFARAVRTAITKAKRGAFKDTHPTELLAAVLKATVDRTKIDPKLIGDIVVGTVLPPGGVQYSVLFNLLLFRL